MSGPLRCHLRQIRVGKHTFQVLTPRPQDGLRFSTNYFHDTWHIVCSPGHVRALRRLFWATAFERHDNSLILLSGALLNPTPFDAAPSLPVILANSERTTLRHDDVALLLKLAAREHHPDGTVKLQTFGLDAIDALEREDRRRWFREQSREAEARGWSDLKVEKIGGAIAFFGPPPLLRQVASIKSLERPLSPGGSDQEFIGGDPRFRYFPGEIQVFGDYSAMLTDARLVRESNPSPAPGESPLVHSEKLCQARALRSTERRSRPPHPSAA